MTGYCVFRLNEKTGLWELVEDHCGTGKECHPPGLITDDTARAELEKVIAYVNTNMPGREVSIKNAALGWEIVVNCTP